MSGIRDGIRGFLATLLVAGFALGTLSASVVASPGLTELVSINTDGTQGNDISGRFAGPAISADGQVVAFDSIASTLVSGDSNQEADVFVHDRASNTTERVSISTAGGQGNDFSSRPTLDGTGKLVAFDSGASTLVSGDTNQQLDVFVHDRSANTTTRISVTSDEAQGDGSSNSPSFSDDGRYVSFVSTSALVPTDENGTNDIYVRDLVAGTTEIVSVSSAGEEGDSSSTAASISAAGRWVAFSSFATNLVPGDTNGHFDVFIHDRDTGVTELVSVSSNEEQGDAQSSTPSVSADGQMVAFWSSATNLVPEDDNETSDAFVRNRTTGTTELVSVSSDEEQSDGNTPEPGVRGFTASGPDITPDGRFVAFFSSATNLVPGDTNTCPLFFSTPGTCPDVFIRDLIAGTTARVNVAADGTQANDRSADGVISDDGLTVAFFSAANNLVPVDTNTCPLFTAFPGNCPDIFVHELDGNGGGGDADLAVTKTDLRDPLRAGRRLTYLVEVENNGPGSASEVTVTDDLPAGVTFLSATSTSGSCTHQAGHVVCDLGVIGSGAGADIRINVRPREPGNIRNQVSVTAAEVDPVAANNSDVETTRILT
jgi:uncharacterized repeat protein (TIGR01451 family)